ncbi:hypothetical protein BDV93DRAFT_603192 [Ceratobasidium sp. AG-I]|nr:hypothetical protein BDV93DRAFT_603192 [Ceratobasidium sp. AG-I]
MVKGVPAEIHLHILDFALSDPFIYVTPKFFPVWPTFVLVCRSWRARVQYSAFQNTNITRIQWHGRETKVSDHGLAQLCFSSYLASLSSPYTHKLGDCIRSLVLYLVSPTEMMLLLQQLPVLESLTFLIRLPQDWASLDADLRVLVPSLSFPSITGLHIFQSPNREYKKARDTTLFIPRLVSCFPNVAYLSLELNCMPSVPISKWPAPPKHLVAFRSLGSGASTSHNLITHFISPPSGITLRVLKIWNLTTLDAHAFAIAHGATLECLTLHPPPGWSRRHTLGWTHYLGHFTALRHLSLGSLLIHSPDILGFIITQKLKHFEFTLLPNRKDLVPYIVTFLDECPVLSIVTYHSVQRCTEIDDLLSKKKIEGVWVKWLDPTKEPFPDHVVLGGSFTYSSWEDVAILQPPPLRAVTPSRIMTKFGSMGRSLEGEVFDYL